MNLPPDDYDDLESLPVERHRYDPQDTPTDYLDEDDLETEYSEDDSSTREPVLYRGTGSDPTFGYLIALALSVGLLPLVPNNTDLRYTVAWGVLALFGVLSWLFGTTTRIGRETVENLAWGGVFGLIIAAPLVLIGGGTLTTTVHLMFRTGVGLEVRSLPPGAVLAYLVFVMPLAESLFFRGFMQQNRPFALVGALSSVWSMVLFVPLLNVGEFPLIGIIICILLVMINLVYSYVRERNGLASAWVCQIVINFVLLFLPYLTP
jgi:hypothetical protein